ncbi:cation channel sperm-associated protein 1 [Suncus etruscus]|uniref:cation channel sperm-associated protein 1 n=1 Tax=Suncus etruscus TaxID=109475 RepID=UPI0021103E09|nr:cation channel sperm-associated protein 1 [Suncus etruscus]
MSTPYRLEPPSGPPHSIPSSSYETILMDPSYRELVQQPELAQPPRISSHHNLVPNASTVRLDPVQDDSHKQPQPGRDQGKSMDSHHHDEFLPQQVADGQSEPPKPSKDQASHPHTQTLGSLRASAPRKVSLRETDFQESTRGDEKERHPQKHSHKKHPLQELPYDISSQGFSGTGPIPSQVLIQHLPTEEKHSFFKLRSPNETTEPQVFKKVPDTYHEVSQGPSEDDSDSDDKDKQDQKLKVPHVHRPHKRLKAMNLCCWLWEEIIKLYGNFRKMISKLTSSRIFDLFVAFIIYINIITLVAQTFAIVEVRGEWYFMALDTVFLCIYMIEAMLKIIAQGFLYFSNTWNKLDFFIMSLAVVDFMLVQNNYFSFNRQVYNQNLYRIFKVLKSLRALRAIRVMRKLRFLSSLQKVTTTLARSLPSITAILILMFTCLILFSTVLRALFHHSDPKHFQNFLTTIFTLFTLLTLDDWSLIYLQNWETGAWYIVPILMVYIIIQYFIFHNLVIAVLVDNFQMALLKGLEQEKQEVPGQDFQLQDDSMSKLAKTDSYEELSDVEKRQQMMEKKFGTMTEKQKEFVIHFLQLVAAVELHQQKFRSQASIIDEIVDTAFEVKGGSAGGGPEEAAGPHPAHLSLCRLEKRTSSSAPAETSCPLEPAVS